MVAKETDTRIIIDKLLLEADWKLPGWFPDEEVNVETEIKNKFGKADYVLLSSKENYLCTIEAKNKLISPLLGKEQARGYAKSLNCRFVILSNGITHYLWDIKQGNPILIEKFPTQLNLEMKRTFNPPRNEEEINGINKDYLVLTQFPKYKYHPDFKNESTKNEFLKKKNLRMLRDYQLNAIKAIQQKIKNGGDRFLIEMATGTGKTTTSAAIIKMFLRLYKIRKVLFLVDRLELEKQAQKEIDKILKNDFETIIWKEKRDNWKRANIVISTVQSFTKHNKYKRIFKEDSFDLVISDEAHRSLGLRSRNVFEYFIGFKLGLTATPRDFLKSVNKDRMTISDPKQLERRLLLDTFSIFGCEEGEPTFRYTLLDGVKDGFLINPIVVDVETGLSAELMTKEGLSFKGVDKDGKDVEEITFYKKDFEKKFKSNETNISFCDAFMQNAIKDPYTDEIGKTLVFCVSQKHASKITKILNELSEKYFPNQYESDFAMQITSGIKNPDPQQMAIDFSNNNLGGFSKVNEYYRTSKSRVCVTVGMMTTGYDCRDIVNICLFRPIFSPIEFIQMKGRGTRLFDFKECWIEKNKIIKNIKSTKSSFKLFDYFKNYKFFEEEFNYDEVLKLPAGGKNKPPIYPPIIDEVFNKDKDPLNKTDEIKVSSEGMKIDRDLYKSFTKEFFKDKEAYSNIKNMIENKKFEEAEKLFQKKYLVKPYSLDALRKSLELDVNISIKDLLLHIFGFIPKLKNKREILEDEFDKFDDKFKPDTESFDDVKNVFEAYVTDEIFRKTLNELKYAELNVHPMGNYFFNLSEKFRQTIPSYIKKNIDLEKFINVG